MIAFAPALAALGTPAVAATVAIYTITGLIVKATLFPKKGVHRMDAGKRKYRKRRKAGTKKV